MATEPLLLNPCPGCGKRFDFPLTGCMTFFDESRECPDGNCAECGTQVIVDKEVEPSAWELCEDIRVFRIDELELSVRSRNSVEKLGIHLVGELLDLSVSQITEACGENAKPLIRELNEMLEQIGVQIK